MLLFPCPHTSLQDLVVYPYLKGQMPPATIAVGLSLSLGARGQESVHVQPWDPSTKQMVLSHEDLSLDAFSLLGSLRPSWTVGFGCSLLSVPGNAMARRLQPSAPQDPVDYFSWHHPAAVVFTNLVELASLHEPSQLTAA